MYETIPMALTKISLLKGKKWDKKVYIFPGKNYDQRKKKENNLKVKTIFSLRKLKKNFLHYFLNFSVL